MTQRKKIKATYRNGVIEPLDKINLPEGQALEIEFRVLLKTPHELSREEKKELIQKMNGSMKGIWGSTVEEIDAYIKSERQSWDREFQISLPIQVLEVNYEIAERAGKLRSQYPSVPTPDALIVATALENDCDIFVTNDKRLKKLEVYGLTVIVLQDFVELP